MMMTQLANVAIKASVRVSPATVPPKLVSRSNNRSGSSASVCLELLEHVLGDVGLEVGAENELGSRLAGAADGSGGTGDLETRCGIGDLGFFQHLGEHGRDDLCGGLGAVESRRVDIQLVLAPPGETGRGRDRRGLRGVTRRRRRGGGDRLAVARSSARHAPARSRTT